MPRKSIITSIALILTDQLTKYVITFAFLPGSSIEVLPFFRLTYLTNTGIAFSLFQGANILFAIFTLAAAAYIAVWYARNYENLPKRINLPIVLIFSGAVGNLIDRIFRGHVVDFLDFSIGSYHWPAFNVADSCVTIGGILLVIGFLTVKDINKLKII